MKENLHKIKKYSSLNDKEFWSDERNIFSVKHLLLVSIEACGNICVHISAKRLYKAASSFAECFENFYKEGI
ncbi:MAG: HepT-like ribonuclease domain-containing protein, partial [Candidatus Aminicenantaceae bacterium]